MLSCNAWYAERLNVRIRGIQMKRFEIGSLSATPKRLKPSKGFLEQKKENVVIESFLKAFRLDNLNQAHYSTQAQ